jgi:hypothetical protein
MHDLFGSRISIVKKLGGFGLEWLEKQSKFKQYLIKKAVI